MRTEVGAQGRGKGEEIRSIDVCALCGHSVFGLGVAGAKGGGIESQVCACVFFGQCVCGGGSAGGRGADQEERLVCACVLYGRGDRVYFCVRVKGGECVCSDGVRGWGKMEQNVS